MSELFCPLHEAKLRKKSLFIDQSAFSNFALYVIKNETGACIAIVRGNRPGSPILKFLKFITLG